MAEPKKDENEILKKKKPYREVLLESVEQYDEVIRKSQELLKQESSVTNKIKLLWLISSNITKKTELFKNHLPLQKSNEELKLSNLGWSGNDQTDL